MNLHHHPLAWYDRDYTVPVLPSDSARVFISYARRDGEQFATALRQRLSVEEPEITLWQDRARLEGGVDWWPQIQAALDEVKFLVVVITPNAVASDICKREWRYARQRGVNVYPVKGVSDDHFDYRQLPRWMRDAHIFNIGRPVDGEWRDVQEWATFVQYLKSDRRPPRVPNMVPFQTGAIVRREEEMATVTRFLIDSADSLGGTTTLLEGSGGYGKTTLAVATCHQKEVIDAFDDGILWTTLGQRPDVLSELLKLHEYVTGARLSFMDANLAAIELASKLDGRACLLVIDDAWEAHHVTPFLRIKCARLITTRRLNLVPSANRFKVGEMRASEALSVLRKGATTQSDSRVLNQLSDRVGHWPLLLNLSAGVLANRIALGDDTERALKYVFTALNKGGPGAFDPRNAHERDSAVSATVAASLDLLDKKDSQRFVDLAVFAGRGSIPLSLLERYWCLDLAEVEECLQRLHDLGLVSLNLGIGAVSLHDVMSEYLLRRVPEAAELHARVVASCSDPRYSEEPYGWRWLLTHAALCGHNNLIRDLSLQWPWLKGKLNACGPFLLLDDLYLSDDDDIKQLRGAVRLSLGALTARPEELAWQLTGRLRAGLSPRLDKLRDEILAAANEPRFVARQPNLQPPARRLYELLPASTSPIRNVIFVSESSPRAAIWASDGTLRLWDLWTGVDRVVAADVNRVVYLGVERFAAFAKNGTVTAWDVEPLRLFHAVQIHTAEIRAIALLPDGRLITGSSDGTIRIWDPRTGNTTDLTRHSGSVDGIEPLQEGRAVSWAGSTIRVWNVAAGSFNEGIEHQYPVYDVLELSDGRFVSKGMDLDLFLWDPSTLECARLTGHSGSPLGVLELAGLRLLSWSADDTLRLWDLATRESVPLRGHTDMVHGAFTFDNGRRAVSWSKDRTVRLWDLPSGESREIGWHGWPVRGARPLDDGRVLSWSYDDDLRIWNIETGEVEQLIGHCGPVNGASVSNDSIVSWADDGTVCVWDLAAAPGRDIIGHPSTIKGATLMFDNRPMTWSEDGLLTAWDVPSGTHQVLATYQGPVSGALALDDRRVVSWSLFGQLRCSDPVTGTSEDLLENGMKVWGVTALNRNWVLAWFDDETLRVLDLNERQWRVLRWHNGPILGAITLSEDHALSWSSDGATLMLWNVSTEEGNSLLGHEQSVRGALALPRMRAFTYDRGGVAMVWDILTRKGVQCSGHENEICGAVLTHDMRVVSWSSDSIWSWGLKDLSGSLVAKRVPVSRASALPDGRLLTCDGDRVLRIWESSSKHRLLLGPADVVADPIGLAAGPVLSAFADGSLRAFDAHDGRELACAHFDAPLRVLLACGGTQVLAGDALGGVHILDYLQ